MFGLVVMEGMTLSGHPLIINKMSYSPCELQENKNPASEVISTHFDVFFLFYFLQKLPCSCQESMPQKLVKIP
jgi:hypothetical protein